MIYRLTDSDFAALDAAFRLQDLSEYQRAVTTWYIYQDPETGEVRPSYGLPNRSTPKALALLLVFSRASLDLADQAAEEFGAAGLPLITDKTAYDQLVFEIGKAKDRFAAYEAANMAAISRGVGDTVSGDPEWFELVFIPIFSTPGVDFMAPKRLERMANVGKQAIDDAVDGLKSDLESGVKDLALPTGAIVAAIAGLYVLAGLSLLKR